MQSIETDLAAEISVVYGYFAALAPRFDPAVALGGKLIFAGIYSQATTPLLRASGISGLGSLAICPDPSQQREALRLGICDILVTSLDEALRILKVELRKRQSVSVLLSGDPATVAEEMLARGLQPDLVASAADPVLEKPFARFVELGAQQVEPQPMPEAHRLVLLNPPPGSYALLQSLDAKLQALVPESDHVTRRWLRLAPRFLGNRARRLRSIALPLAEATALEAELAAL